MFIDHWKDRYLPDLKLLEQANIMRNGTVVFADNIIKPGTMTINNDLNMLDIMTGAPEYAEYVRTSPKYETKFFDTHVEYSDDKDQVAVSVYRG